MRKISLRIPGLKKMAGRLKQDTKGDAVVEAAFLFPIMTLIMAALVLVSIYLPAQALLQWSTQYAATALAVEMSDTWLSYSTDNMAFYLISDKADLTNVYTSLFEHDDGTISAKGELIAEVMESQGVSARSGSLTVSCHLNNALIYKEIIVEARREFPMPVNLSIIGFPDTITVTGLSTAVVQNGDELIRNVDMATDFAQFLAEKFNLTGIADAISSFGGQVKDLLGW